MQTLGLLVAPVLGFYHKFLRFSLRILLLMFMDFPSTFKFIAQASELTCGFLLLGYFSRLFNLLGLLLIFFFCLRFLRSPVLKNKDDNNKSRSRDEILKDDEAGFSREENLEDEVFDVMSLRRMIKAERQRFNVACAEIEKEQGAAASAAEEAMAMILRLQSEKSAVEIQAKQFRRVVEQRQEYDHEVMESLRWTVVQVESQKNLLERQLGVFRERLRQFVNEREIERLQQQQQEQQQEEQEQQEEEQEQQEEEEGAASDGVDDANGEDEDADSNGFLNFCVEYDVDADAAALPAAESQNNSPTHNHTQQQQL